VNEFWRIVESLNVDGMILRADDQHVDVQAGCSVEEDGQRLSGC
jgi:hypothetical protein